MDRGHGVDDAVDDRLLQDGVTLAHRAGATRAPGSRVTPARWPSKTERGAATLRAMHGSGRVVIVMGVAGSGKTTVGRLLADRLGWRFEDADDYHSAANKLKMSRAEPLEDADRAPWLAALRELVAGVLQRDEHAVLACSALKRRYRRELCVDPERVVFVYLKSDPVVIRQRLRQRTGHYASESLLESQFDALEEPDDAIEVDAARPPEQIVTHVQALMSDAT